MQTIMVMMILLEVALTITSIALAVSWVLQPDAEFEPAIVLCGVLAAAIEVARRYLAARARSSEGTSGRESEVVTSEEGSGAAGGNETSTQGTLPAEPGTMENFGRALLYALTNFAAICAGYLLNAQTRAVEDALLVMALWFSSGPFFLSYAIAYHFDDPSVRESAYYEKARYESRILLPVFCYVLAALCVSAFFAVDGELPSLFLHSIGFVAIASLLYGNYIIGRFARDQPKLMRHQLVWPVVLSIAIPIYLGAVFANADGMLQFFTPIVLVVGLFFATLRLKRKPFMYMGFGVCGLVVVGRAIDVETGWPWIWSFAFYLTAAAYLAVFEAWAVTASYAREANAQGEPVFGDGAFEVEEDATADVEPIQPEAEEMEHGADNSARETQEAAEDEDEINRLPTPHRYYLATLLATALAGLALPLQFIFSGYGRVFLYGVAIHPVYGFWRWYKAGAGVESLVLPGWRQRKTWVGSAFLAILVLDAFLEFEIDEPFIRPLVEPAVLVIALVVVGLLLGVRVWVGGAFTNLGRKRDGPALLTVALAAVLAMVVLAIQGFIQDATDSVLANKIDRVFFLYLGWMILAAALLAGQAGVQFLGSITTVSWHLGLVTRFLSSSVVAMAVFLPAIAHGRFPMEGLVWALPFFFASAGGCALNDYFDHERDAISKPYRPIPAGVLSRVQVLVLALTLIGSGMVTAALAAQDLVQWALYTCAIVGVLLYNVIMVRAAWAKGAHTAILAMLPVAFVVYTLELGAAYWILATAGLFYVTGRELLIDVLDRKGDMCTGIRTLPVILGKKVAGRLAWGFIGAGTIAMVWFASISASSMQSYLAGVSIAVSIALFPLWLTASLRQRRWIVRLAWAPLVVALFALFPG